MGAGLVGVWVLVMVSVCVCGGCVGTSVHVVWGSSTTSLHFGSQVLDTDQPTQVTIRFFKEVSVRCQEIFAHMEQDFVVCNFMYLECACVCGGGGGEGEGEWG